MRFHKTLGNHKTQSPEREGSIRITEETEESIRTEKLRQRNSLAIRKKSGGGNLSGRRRDFWRNLKRQKSVKSVLYLYNHTSLDPKEKYDVFVSCVEKRVKKRSVNCEKVPQSTGRVWETREDDVEHQKQKK